MQIFEFTRTSPPSDRQFEAIAQFLLTRLCQRTGVTFETTETHIESDSWVTIKVRSQPVAQQIVDLTFVGIISYSLRDATPSIQSVLLPFSMGKRLSTGRNTILSANYIADEPEGKWSEFRWDLDGYGEWECAELPPG